MEVYYLDEWIIITLHVAGFLHPAIFQYFHHSSELLSQSDKSGLKVTCTVQSAEYWCSCDIYPSPETQNDLWFFARVMYSNYYLSFKLVLIKINTCTHMGVRDQFRLGGLRSVARIFSPLLARKSSGFAWILHDFFLPEYGDFYINSRGAAAPPAPPPPPPPRTPMCTQDKLRMHIPFKKLYFTWKVSSCGGIL